MDVDTSQRTRTLGQLVAPVEGDFLYGVVDGAQNIELAYEAQQLFGHRMRMLFLGDAAPAMADVAPYLIAIDPNSGYLDRWAMQLWTNAGILLSSPADADTLFDHLRHIFKVKNEDGQHFYFRFYDPRVLRAFLPACTDEERALFFGPIRCFTVEGEKEGCLLHFKADEAEPKSLNVMRAEQPQGV